MRKFLILVCSAIGLASVARGEATSITMVNKSDGPVNCAYLEYVPSSNQATTYHWYAIANGQSRIFNAVASQGLITNFRCEATRPGDNRVWGRNGFACVTRGANYINPFFEANNLNLCTSLKGEWKSFTRVTQTGAVTHILNP